MKYKSPVALRQLTIYSGMVPSKMTQNIIEKKIQCQFMCTSTDRSVSSNSASSGSSIGINNNDLPDLYPKKIEDILDMEKINQEHPINFEHINMVEIENQDLKNLKTVQQMLVSYSYIKGSGWMPIQPYGVNDPFLLIAVYMCAYV